MNRKMIFGITALLAVLTMCLAFTACPQDTDDSVVTFYNDTRIKISITSQSDTPFVELPARADTTETLKPVTLTRAGKKIVITTITYDSTLVQGNPDKYIDVDGVAYGAQELKDGSIELKQAVITFRAKKNVDGSPAKVDVIPLDE